MSTQTIDLSCDGTVTELSEPHFEPEPPAFLALLSWVGHSIGTDLVLFAVHRPAGWRMVSYPRSGAGAHRAIRANPEDREPASPAQALRDEGLLCAVADRRRPTEINQRALASICPRLVDAGVRCVVGAPLYAPSGHLAAVIVAAYRGPGSGDQVTPFAPVAGAGPETVGCMGKLLAAAHRNLRAIPGPAPKVDEGPAFTRASDPLAGDPDGFLRSREVAAMLAVRPRTIANWARDGALPATRTDGGHLRFRRRDVRNFFEARTSGRKDNA